MLSCRTVWHIYLSPERHVLPGARTHSERRWRETGSFAEKLGCGITAAVCRWPVAVAAVSVVALGSECSECTQG